MANRYWVGGTGNWDASTTTHWSDTSGGAGGFSIPTSADNVYFDLHSNEPTDAAYTVTITSPSFCSNLDVSFVGTTKVTISGSQFLDVFGNVNLSGGSAQVAWTHYSSLRFNNTSGVKTITTNGVTMACTLAMNAAGTVQLASDYTSSASFPFVINSGQIDTATGTVTLKNGNTTHSANVSFYNLVLTPSPAKTNQFILNRDLVVSNIFTIDSGATTTNRIFVRTNIAGTSRTITAASVSINNADFMDITGSGAASWNLSAVAGGSGNCGGNTGITFTTAVDKHWNGTNGGNWSERKNWGGIDSYSAGVGTSDIRSPGNSCNEAGQVFYVASNTTLGSCSFNLLKVGSPTGNTVCKIYNITGTPGINAVATGGALATSDAVSASTFSSSAADIFFSFSGGNKISLSAGTWYAVTYSPSDLGDSNYTRMVVDAASPSHSGNQTVYNTFSSTWVANSAIDIRFSVFGDSAIVPLPQDNVYFDCAFGASKTVTADMPRLGKSIDWTGATWTTALSFDTSGTENNIFGSLTLISGLTTTPGTTILGLRGRGNYVVDTKGVSLSFPLTMIAPGGTYKLASNLTLSVGNNYRFTLSAGTFSCVNGASNYALSANTLDFSTGVASSVLELGSATHSITGGSGSNIFYANGFLGTLNAGTSTIKFTNSSNDTITLSLASLTYNNIWFSRGASTGQIRIYGNNTFNDFKDDGTEAHALVFTHGSTQHVTTFNVNGSAGKEITINSETSATHALVKDGGGTITANYLNIQHSVATPTLTWLATNSTDNQAVATAGSGWYFGTFPQNINVSDNLNIAENIVRSRQSFISAFDQAAISENNTFSGSLGFLAIDLINISELSAITKPTSALSPNIIDFISATESVSLPGLTLPPFLVFESLNVTESVINILAFNISTGDTLNLSEASEVDLLVKISQTENMGIIGSLAVTPLLIDVNQLSALNITESISPSLQIRLAVTGSITVSESSVLRADLGNIIVNDRVKASEEAGGELIDNVTVYDTIHSSESIGMESFRFAPSPANSQPLGRRSIVNPIGRSSWDT